MNGERKQLSGRERFLAAMQGKTVDRAPVFCANQTATYEQMEQLGVYWPAANEKGEAMARLALGSASILEFDTVKVPFCQTIEAEALGCVLKQGGRQNLPSVDVHPYKIGDEPRFPDDFLQRGRIPQLIEAVRICKREAGDRVVVLGGIIGPFSIAASLLGMQEILVASLKRPDAIQPYLAVAERAGTILAHALLEAGADVISIEDMMASLDIISPKIYENVVAPWETKQISQIGGPAILHICGKVDAVVEQMARTGAAVLSVEPKTDVRLAREKLAGLDRFVAIAGGVDAIGALFSGTPAEVRDSVRAAVEAGYHMIAPGCSIPPATPLPNLKAMVEAVQDGQQ